MPGLAPKCRVCLLKKVPWVSQYPGVSVKVLVSGLFGQSQVAFVQHLYSSLQMLDIAIVQ